MKLETLTREIKNITTIFEGGDESTAFHVIRTVNSIPTLLNIQLDNPKKNKEFVEAVDRLWKFKDKIEAETSNSETLNFVTRIYNLQENARRNLNA